MIIQRRTEKIADTQQIASSESIKSHSGKNEKSYEKSYEKPTKLRQILRKNLRDNLRQKPTPNPTPKPTRKSTQKPTRKSTQNRTEIPQKNTTLRSCFDVFLACILQNFS